MRALVLSGGGSKGSFQAGVLRTILDNEPNTDYDIYAGVSVGALNCSKLATGPLAEVLPELEDVWLKKVKGSHSVWRHHLWYYVLAGMISIAFFIVAGFISFIFNGPQWLTTVFGIFALVSFIIPWIALTRTHSIYRTEPLRKLIEETLDLDALKNGGKRLRVGAVSFTTGEYRTVDEHNEHIIDWVMASSAFPIFFPRIPMLGQYWGDGGITDVSPLKDAIEAGATEVDIILASSTKPGYYHGLPGVLKQISRDLDVMQSEILRNDLEVHCMHANIKVRVFMPEGPLTSNPLSFEPERIRRMYEEGKRVAEKTLKKS